MRNSLSIPSLIALFLSITLPFQSRAAFACSDLGILGAATAEQIKKQNPWIQERLKNLSSEIEKLQRLHPDKMSVETYGEVSGHKLLKIQLRPTQRAARAKVVITAGLHGNETLGSLTSVDVIKLYLKQPEFFENIDLTVYPMTNPVGLAHNKRRVRNEVDLNRVFSRESTEPEVMSLIKDLDGKNFDLALDLHGGPTKETFFVIRSKEDMNLAKEVVDRFSQDLFLASNNGEYPGRSGIPKDPDRYLMSSHGVAQSNLPGTLKSFLSESLQVPYAYTVEYPGRKDPKRSLAINRAIVREFLRLILERKK